MMLPLTLSRTFFFGVSNSELFQHPLGQAFVYKLIGQLSNISRMLVAIRRPVPLMQTIDLLVKLIRESFGPCQLSSER